MNSPVLKSNFSVAGHAEISGKEARIFVSPLAKRLAKDAGINLNLIKGTGPHGRIVKNDIERASMGEVAQFSEVINQDTSNIPSPLPVILPTGGTYT